MCIKENKTNLIRLEKVNLYPNKVVMLRTSDDIFV